MITFDSWEDLVDKLQTTDRRAVSAAMMAFNAVQEAEIVEKWRGVLRRVIPAARRPALNSTSYEDRMDRIFGAGEWAEY